MEDIIDVKELEQAIRQVLRGRKYNGQKVLLSMDGKVLCRTLDKAQNGTYLLPTCPMKGLS
jgi:hypothetical protein